MDTTATTAATGVPPEGRGSRHDGDALGEDDEDSMRVVDLAIPSLEAQLANIVTKYDAMLAPLMKDRKIAAADVSALGPQFAEQLAALKKKQAEDGYDNATFAEVGKSISELEAKTRLACEYHQLRVSELDAKISRLLQARTKEEDAAKAAAAPPPDEE